MVDLSPYKPGADGADLAKDADPEMGVAQWRARGLPPAQSREQRWGASYPLQFRILFMRCAPLALQENPVHTLWGPRAGSGLGHAKTGPENLGQPCPVETV